MVRAGPTTWTATFETLSERAHNQALEAEELEQLATAAYMIGDDATCERAWVDAHHAWVDLGQPARAARCAFWQALGLFFHGDLAPATGWVARGRRLLQNLDHEVVEHVWLRMLTGLPRLFSGDTRVHSAYADAVTMAEELHDPDAAMFARICNGYALILDGSVIEGMAMLDEAMVSVVAHEVHPLLAGIGYCQVIALCQAVFDLRRAREWTDALTRWCEEQPDLVPFRGNCLVHRCEIFQLSGAWPEALEAARQACSLPGDPSWDFLGSAYYQLGEIQRLRGDSDLAQNSYLRASRAGRDPQPGAALLLQARGHTDSALAALRRALDEASAPSERARLLPAYVEVAIETQDIPAAYAAADDLAAIADSFDAAYLRAAAALACGAVQIAQGDPGTAVTSLRLAERRWHDLQAPYQTAKAQTLLGLAFRAVGDETTARMELEAALASFERLGAIPDITRLRGLLAVHGSHSAGLSGRETEVLRLVATGRTNRAVAKDLSIAEKTVARHLANIFSKLGLSSRTEATAFAFKHGIAR